MSTWKLISGVALVFILGLLAGLLPSFYLMHNFPPPPPPPPMDQRNRNGVMLERLSRDLDLTEGQRIRIGKIVKQMGERLDQHFLRVQSEVRTIFDEGFSQIEGELDNPQKEKLHALRERMERHRRPGGPFP